VAVLLLLAASLGPARAEGPARRSQEPELAIAVWREDLVQLLRQMDSQPEIFPAARLERALVLGPSERARVVALWGRFVGVLLALEQLADRNGDFHQREGADQLRSFHVHRAAFLASYRFSMDLIERLERDRGLGVLLDEAHPQLGLPARSFARHKFHYLNVAAASRYLALEALNRNLGFAVPSELAAGARADRDRILEMGRGRGPLMTGANALRIVQDTALAAWMPTQENVARFMGEVRVRRHGEALISEEQIRALRPRLEPGDILLERREWYLTNAGIPGFWPHAALYVGTPEERASFLDDADVAAWLATRGADSFESLLGAAHPETYARSLHAEMGRPRRVLEAIADGVSFTSLEHSAAADSLAVLRPRLPKRERAEALLRAFGYAGRPYDYNFDFRTDAALVCSELIYKAYQPDEGMRGLELPLEAVAGRLMMTPNEIAHRFALERGSEQQQLDFVLMLDGDERSRRAHPVSAETFALSWKRPKWHIITASSPAADGEAGSR